MPIPPEPSPSVPPSTDFEFGTNTVFHVGDNDYGSSSCLGELREYPIIGSIFYFMFDVLADDTTVDVTISKVCGVDFNDSNLSSVVNQSSRPMTGPVVLTTADNGGIMTLPKGKLNRGRYWIKVESRQNPRFNYDRDDFIFGKIRVRTDKKVQPGGIFAVQ